MDIKRLSKETISYLKKCGWSKHRNYSKTTFHYSMKNTFEEFNKIANSLGGLIYDYGNSNEEKRVYFDLDESSLSKDIRAKSFCYESHHDPNWINDVEFRATEDFSKTKKVNENGNINCSRIGFWYDDDLGYDVYVEKSGAIYIAHSDIPILFADSIENFLNKITADD